MPSTGASARRATWDAIALALAFLAVDALIITARREPPQREPTQGIITILALAAVVLLLYRDDVMEAIATGNEKLGLTVDDEPVRTALDALAGKPELDGDLRQTPLAGPDEAAAALAGIGRDHPAFVLLSPDGAALVEGSEHALDTALVDSLPLSDVEYTASVAEAERAVSSGEATAAFIVRPPTVQQVEEFARAGVRMPPKSTYFFPKLTSGLLLSPFDE